MTPELNRIYPGDNLATMRAWPDAFVQTCVTSPPYFGLRDYGVAGQIGLEATPEAFVARLVEVFRKVRRVLRDDGTLWVNMGDSYATNSSNGWQGKNSKTHGQIVTPIANRKQGPGLKSKDLIGVPWMLAFALRADGWYLRSEIIWAKKNCMPESVTDRPTKSHEHIFLLAKSDRYYYDADAIKEPVDLSQVGRERDDQIGGNKGSEVHHSPGGKYSSGNKARKPRPGAPEGYSGHQQGSVPWEGSTRNKRDVWSVATQPFAEAHFATFPPDLIKPCVLAGAPPRGLVLDPFMGAGTTALVAAALNRQFLGCELNPEYIKIAEKRVAHEVAQHKLF